jgi:hypothetical protein
VVVVGGLAAVSGGPALGWHWCRWASRMVSGGGASARAVAWRPAWTQALGLRPTGQGGGGVG